MAIVSKIMIYPIKSMDGLSVEKASVSRGGALVGDRAHYLQDHTGKIFNAKRSAKCHLIRSRFSEDLQKVCFSPQANPLDLKDDLADINQQLSSILGESVWVKRAGEGGCPDDVDAPGLTLVSEATLSRVGHWFELSEVEVLRRFRPNLVISGVEPFWEDQWLGEHEGDGGVLRINGVEFKALKACRRCVVPTRSSQDGSQTPEFVEIFKRRRTSELHSKALVERFKMSYRLCINTVRVDDKPRAGLAVGAHVYGVES